MTDRCIVTFDGLDYGDQAGFKIFDFDIGYIMFNEIKNAPYGFWEGNASITTSPDDQVSIRNEDWFVQSFKLKKITYADETILRDIFKMKHSQCAWPESWEAFDELYSQFQDYKTR